MSANYIEKRIQILQNCLSFDTYAQNTLLSKFTVFYKPWKSSESLLTNIKLNAKLLLKNSKI